MVGARAQQLNPFEFARSLGNVIGHPKREQHVASFSDEGAHFLRRAALPIDDFSARNGAGDRPTMSRLQCDCRDNFHD
jgi:hypothetical protein